LCRKLKLKTLTEEEISKIIYSLKSKSCELDLLPTKHLKLILPSICKVITILINKSIVEGFFPSKWKTAVIRPLLKKKGLDLTVNNYRPVSNLNFMSKVLERAVFDQLRDHSEKHNLLPDTQSAYREGYSCETALVRLVNDVLMNMEMQRVTALVAIDLSAAFDTVDHDILLNVLKTKFGIEAIALNWFDSYLRPRNCVVNIGEKYSDPKQLAFSVPQGSIGGPYLYLGYASTLPEEIGNDVDLYGFADDHTVETNFKASNGLTNDEELAIDTLENALQNIKSWMSSNRLKMNDAKTEFILLGSKQQLNKCVSKEINVNGVGVERSSLVKYLGISLDDQVSFKQHINNKCSIAMGNLMRVKQIRKHLSIGACHTLVKGIVISHLDYGNSILINLPDCEIKKMQRVQNMAAKLILNKSKYDSARSCLKELHWLPVKLRIEHKILCLVFKTLKCKAPNYMKNMLQIYKPKRENSRSNSGYMKLVVPPTKLKTFADRSFSVAGPKLWNNIPEEIRMCDKLETFKRKLKTYLFSKY
jgi:hypothetical protein